MGSVFFRWLCSLYLPLSCVWVGCGLGVASAAYEATDVACYVFIVPAGGGRCQELFGVVSITILWVVFCLSLFRW